MFSDVKYLGVAKQDVNLFHIQALEFPFEAVFADIYHSLFTLKYIVQLCRKRVRCSLAVLHIW